MWHALGCDAPKPDDRLKGGLGLYILENVLAVMASVRVHEQCHL